MMQTARKSDTRSDNAKNDKAQVFRAEAVTLKKVEQRNRTHSVQLKNRCKLYDLEQGAVRATFKKKKRDFKQQIQEYEKRLGELKDLKLDSSGTTFVTEVKGHERDAEESFARQHNIGATFDLEAVGSIRRQTKPTQGGALIGRALQGLHRLQKKHLQEYEEAMASLKKLEHDVGMSIDIALPRRSYTPPDSSDTPFKSASFLLYQRGQIKAKEKELFLLGQRNAKKARPKTAPHSVPLSAKSERLAADDGAAQENRVNIFCLRQKQSANAANRNGTTLTEFDERKLRKVDGSKVRSEDTASAKLARARNITIITKNLYSDMVNNPFDDGVIPEVTRSRLLIQAQKDDRMYVWLGFTSYEEMMKALKSKDGKIKQIPTALLHVLEDAGNEDTAEVLDNLVETESEASSDEEDSRFKIFDEMKIMGKKRKIKAKHTV